MGKRNDYICVDLEMTGLDPGRDKIIEIGAVFIRNGKTADSFEALVRPGKALSRSVREITGISDEMLQDQRTIREVIHDYAAFEERAAAQSEELAEERRRFGTNFLPLLGHAVHYDYAFLKRAFVNEGLKYEREAMDTLKIARVCLDCLPSRSLEELTHYYGIGHDAHRAMNDAKATAALYERLWEEFGQREDAPKLFAPVKMNCHIKRQAPIRPRQKERLLQLLERHKIVPDYEIDSLMRNEADRLIDCILSQYGR